jgi:hypothetical protein
MTEKPNTRNRPLEEFNDDNDDDGVGTTALSVEKLSALFNEAQNKAFNENRRRYEGQGKFGPGSFVEKNSSPSNGFGETLLSHPFFEDTQYFSGIDSALSPNPTDNPEAYEQFQQKRLEYQRRLQKNLGLDASASKNITLAR